MLACRSRHLKTAGSRAALAAAGVRATYLRVLLVVAGAAAVSACAPRFDPLDLEVISESNQAPLSRAMLVPAVDSTPIQNVLESRYSNAYVQELILETNARRPGQNRFDVTFVLPGETGGPGTRDLALARIDPDLIHLELSDRFPDVGMNVSSYFVQNRYGPFGFATGRASAGDTCLYAWQTIVPERRASLLHGPGGRIEVRLQLCDANAREADLLEVMYGFTINAYLSRWDWQPYGDVPVLRPEFGAPGADVRPLAPATAVPVPSPARPRASRTSVTTDGGPLDLDAFLGNSAPASVPAPRSPVAPVDYSLYPPVPPPP